jgi:RNA polymerase sigma-70 factor (ECF subfamily)
MQELLVGRRPTSATSADENAGIAGPVPPGAAACALELLFRRERDGLLRYLKRQIDPQMAGDVAQDVFVRAAASPQILNLENPQGFLRRIARNLILDGLRRTRCRIVTLPLAEAADASIAAHQEAELEADDLRRSLDHALEGLPERTRTIFMMHRFDELGYREIQHRLGISMPAVEYHMMRALAHIRAALS